MSTSTITRTTGPLAPGRAGRAALRSLPDGLFEAAVEVDTPTGRRVLRAESPSVAGLLLDTAMLRSARGPLPRPRPPAASDTLLVCRASGPGGTAFRADVLAAQAEAACHRTVLEGLVEGPVRAALLAHDLPDREVVVLPSGTATLFPLPGADRVTVLAGWCSGGPAWCAEVAAAVARFRPTRLVAPSFHRLGRDGAALGDALRSVPEVVVGGVVLAPHMLETVLAFASWEREAVTAGTRAAGAARRRPVRPGRRAAVR